jgi:flagella basal body P-ring formation protein FlgA
MKRPAALVAVLALLVALAFSACVGSGTPTVVAARDIQIGDVIHPGDVIVVLLAPSQRDPNAMREISQVIGRVSRVFIAKGGQILVVSMGGPGG